MDQGKAEERSRILQKGSYSNGGELSRSQRLASAWVGAVITSICVTPLDVIKTRQQTHASRIAKGQPWKNIKVGSANVEYSNSMLGLFRRILREEGPLRLWRGLVPTLAQSIPSTVLYFNIYDEISSFLKREGFTGTGIPLVAGITARVAAATAVSPIELVRTRLMANRQKGNMLRSVINDLLKERALFGAKALFKGLIPTLLRDVPFSGMYWVGLELLKENLARENQWKSPFWISFTSGAVSGMITAFVTTPMDVVKTRQQVEISRGKLVSSKTSLVTMKEILQKEGISGLFVGALPRVSKVGPACAIMISSYDLFKIYFSTLNKKAE